MAAEENKAIFRRYIEEVPNQGNLEVADEIFDRYLSHQPDGSVLEHGPCVRRSGDHIIDRRKKGT